MTLQRARPRALVLTAGLVAAGWGADARAQEVPPPELSPLQMGLAFGAAAGGVFLLTAGDLVFSPPTPGMGTPAADSVDAEISRSLYRPGEGRFLWGLPDFGGAYVLPVLPVFAYGAVWLTGNPGEGALAARHLFGYVEVMGWTYLATGIVKYMVGRARPYTEEANNHPELRKHESEDTLSFFSGHASSTFALASFTTRDLALALRRTRLARSGPVAGLLWGTVFPYTLGYGVATLVSMSRLIDQQHWPSDVLMGALMGGLIGQLGYTAHFDRQGQPRVRALPLVGSDGRGNRTAQLALVGRF
jgi:membrane-associated phospholipid phosphatase